MNALAAAAETAANDALTALLAEKKIRAAYDGEDPWMTFYWALGDGIDHEMIKPLVIDAIIRTYRVSAPGDGLP